MRKKNFPSALFSLLLSLLMIKLQAQSVLVQGTHLNIGSGNDINAGVQNNYLGNAIGLQNKVKSLYSLAVGTNDTINTNSSYSVALGMYNSIQGMSALALGYSVKLNGDNHIGIGRYVMSDSRNGNIVIGSGVIGQNGAAYLANSTNNSLVVGFNSTKPTLFVSESPNNYGQGITNKTGKVAIGDVTPQAKLHIRSDAGENASIFLEPGDPDEDISFIQFGDAQHRISVDEEGMMGITAGMNKRVSVTSSNFNIEGNLVAIGGYGFTILDGNTSSFGLNAYPSNGYYTRGNDQRSSYVMEFSNASFKLRTATFMNPRMSIISNWSDPLTVKTDGTISLNGKVGVNVENTTQDYALAVDGGIITTKVHIQDVADWQDRVFGKDYPLMSPADLEGYVLANGHLPGIPSEAEVKADGYDVAEMQAALLGKIEELTLHMLRQQKEIDSLRTLVTVRFGYDACGNRTSRTLVFSKMDGDDVVPDGSSKDDGTPWQASISDGFAGGDVLLFPNPTEGGFYLSLTGGDTPQNATATLCTMEGKVLEERAVTGAVEEFDLGGRPAGIYLLRLTSGRETKAWKIIKRN